MKRTERILLIFWITFLLLQGVDYTGGAGIFGLLTFILSLFYLIGSFKLFDAQNRSQLIIAIMAGLSISTSLITIPFNIYLRHFEWLKIFPFINVAFAATIIGLVVFKWIRKNQAERWINGILLRSLSILLVTSFFALRPTEYKIYRKIIIFLNAGNDDLISNMKMIDYWHESEKHLDQENCDDAIKYSLLSFNEGLKWLRIDTGSITEKDFKRLWKIHGTYTNAYNAYECKAKKLNASNNFKEAIIYQIKADSILNINPVALDDSWKPTRADSKNDIGIYYRANGQTDSAISYFSQAIDYHLDSIGTFTSNFAIYLRNLSGSLATEYFWDASNEAAKQSIKVIQMDSLYQDRDDILCNSYLQLVHNAIGENKPANAKQYLQEMEPFLIPKWECKYFLYKSILANKMEKRMQAIEYANNAASCYGHKYGTNHQNVAESHSIAFEAWMQIPNYDSAVDNLHKGMEITRLNHGFTTARYHGYVEREGYYYYAIGDYQKSFERFTAVKNVYELEFGHDSNKLPQVLATMGRIKIEQGELGEAAKLATESLRIINMPEFLIDERSSELLNDIAYIKYVVNDKIASDTLYNNTIELNLKAKNDSSFSVASALNGLGLLAMKKSNFYNADSLFIQSLKLYQYKNIGKHPDIGIILMNQSELSFRLKKYDESLELVNNAIANFSPFHRANHPTIADMYRLKAHILKKKGDRIKAQELFKKALEIYVSNFRAEHYKVLEARNSIAEMDAG
ncbi:MAG: tetratricopeptide repeat protein [bacterium]|nr:tetratricopeptide repeat protein [bacterium]